MFREFIPETKYRILYYITVFLIAFAAPVPAESPFTVTTSVQSINHNADATACGLRLSENINPDLVGSFEIIRIDEGSSAIDLTTYRMEKRLGRSESPLVRGFGGITYLRGNSRVLGDFDAIAPNIGLSASMALPKDLKFDASAGFSLFEKTLIELEAAISQQVGRDWTISAGYKSYNAGGDSIGGPMLSAAWRH